MSNQINFQNVTVNTPPKTFNQRGYVKQAIECIQKWFLTIQQNKEDWRNDWLLMDEGRWMARENVVYEWQKNTDIFKIHTYVKNDGLYFKLLPIHMEYDRSYGYDGVIRNDDELDNVSRVTLEKNGETVQETFTNGFIMWIIVWRDL